MTELDRRLQEIASTNWDQFVALIGDDAIAFAKICLLRRNGNSYGQIKARLNLTKNVVEYACGKCDIPNETTTNIPRGSSPDLPSSSTPSPF